jgi:hypothetical protein
MAMFPKYFRRISIVVMSPTVRIMQMATTRPMGFGLQIIQMPQLMMTYHLRLRVISKGKTPIGKMFLPKFKNSRRTQLTAFSKTNKITAIMAGRRGW